MAGHGSGRRGALHFAACGRTDRRGSRQHSTGQAEHRRLAPMRFRLRTLLILLAIGPPVLAGAWWGHRAWERERRRQLLIKELDKSRNLGPWFVDSPKEDTTAP